MATTIRARFSKGHLEPLENLELRDGEEVTVTVRPSPPANGKDWLEGTAGGWQGLVDGEKLKHDIYESRLISGRGEPRL